jgi:hypothetical protein
VGYERVIRYETRPARIQATAVTEPFHRYIFEDGTVWTEFYRSGKGYLLRFPELADFEISADGTVVIAHPVSGIDEATIEHLYINQLVPLALSRQGRPAYHASVVTVPGGAVAFLGKTGMGKSTLAASFSLNEAAFLTDDALLVEESDSGCRAMPSHASLRLWDDSAEALVDERIAKASAISYSSKARLLAGEALAYCEEPQTLLAAYVLERQGAQDVAIRVLTGLDRYMAWLGNSFLLDIEDHDLLSQHFEWTHRISGAVPTFSLDYPRDYGMLPDVQNAVRHHVANPGN